jgi:hypothetical protein
MVNLEINRKGLFAWDFEVLQNGAPAGRISGSGSRENGTLTIGEHSYAVAPDNSKLGGFNLDANGDRLARAGKSSFWSGAYQFEYAGKIYVFKHSSVFSSKYALLENDQEIVSVRPKGIFKRSAVVEFVDHVPTPVALFAGWVALILWKRQSDSDAVTAGAGV